MKKYYAGIDLGGTKVLTGICDLNGNIISEFRTNTEAYDGDEAVIRNIVNSLHKALDKANLDIANIIKIGIGIPGVLDISKGMIDDSPNLPFKDYSIIEILEEKLGLSVVIENDANAAALGEKMFGAGQGVEDQIYITVSTGIGGGIIIGGQVYHGSNYKAGEIGHMIIKPGGPYCGFESHRGCLESIASGFAVLRRAKKMLRNNDLDSFLGFNEKPEKLTGFKLAKSARRGDEFAKEIYEDMGFYLGIGVSNLINLFNPELLVFGGGVMKAKDLFWDKMNKSVEEHALPTSRGKCEFKNAELGENVGLFGALSVAINKSKKQ